MPANATFWIVFFAVALGAITLAARLDAHGAIVHADRMRTITLFAACALAACSASDPSVSACGGPAPAIDDCIVGAAWADCGGTEDTPRFACRRADGRCHWFAGGCVAEGFEASPCPADDLCCLDAPPTGYPFDASWRTFEPETVAVWDFLRGWGVEPWDRARQADVEVVFGAATPSTPTLTCSAELGAPCGLAGDDLSVLRRAQGALVVRIASARGDLGGWTLTIEALHGDDGALRARVCRTEFVDGVGGLTCSPGTPECATAGTLTMPAFPETAAAAAATPLSLSATFADGTTIDAQL